MKDHTIKLELSIDQLHSFIQFAEDEKEYWHQLDNAEEAERWSKTRDRLAYELDMIADYPFDRVK